IGEVVGGRDDVGGDIDVKRSDEQAEHGDSDGPRVAEAREDFDGVPKGFAEDDHGGGSDSDADEGVEGHRRGEAQRLAESLIALAAGVAGEIGNVEGNSGPEADDSGERGNEEAEKFCERSEFGGSREHRAEAAGFVPSPNEEGEADQQE